MTENHANDNPAAAAHNGTVPPKTPLCDACQGIQRNWRRAPGHAELLQRGNRQVPRNRNLVTITRYVCDHCGTAWDYENDKTNQQVGWSVVDN